MDRRYKQARFYNGTPATDRRVNRSDSLVRSYLARARKQNATGQSYGGSTGGRSSIDSNRGLEILRERATQQSERNEVFKEEGSGIYGARRAKYESRQLPDLGT